MARRTIAELAEDKAALLEELDELNHEIISRAGEVDPSEDDERELESEPAKAAPVKKTPPQKQTATDKTVASTQKATANP